MNYKDMIEKQAGIMHGLNVGQKVIGAGTGALIGGAVGYTSARGNSYPKKMKLVNNFYEDKKNGFGKATGDVQDYAYDGLIAKSPMIKKYVDETEYTRDSVEDWAKKNKVNLDNMTIKDFQNLADDIGVFNYYNGGNASGIKDRKKLREMSLNSLREYGITDEDLAEHNIYGNTEKKAFLTEALVAGIGTGIAANGIGKGVNAVEGLATKKGRKAKKQYKTFKNDKNIQDIYNKYNDTYGFVDSELDNIINQNKNITVGELKSMLKDKYLENINKAAFDIVNESFEKQAGLKDSVKRGFSKYKHVLTGKNIKNALNEKAFESQLRSAIGARKNQLNNQTAILRSATINALKSGNLEFADKFRKELELVTPLSNKIDDKFLKKSIRLQDLNKNIGRERMNTKLVRGATGVGATALTGMSTYGVNKIRKKKQK